MFILSSLIMTKSLPISLRWRVIMSRQRGLSVNQISETLFVSKTFVKKVIRLYENTGAVSDPPRRKSTKRKISGSRKCWPLKLVALWRLTVYQLCMDVDYFSRRNSCHSPCYRRQSRALSGRVAVVVGVSDRWSVCNTNPQQNCTANGIDSKEGTESKSSAVKLS